MIHKIQDTFNDGKSFADQHFPLNERKRFYRLFRNQTSELPQAFETNSENSIETTKEFNLKGLQFGNWLSTEDKFDYLSAFWIGMNDLQKVVRFNTKNLGLGKQLGICFGSRGIAHSKAHYSPKANIINLNRYVDETNVDKMTRFLHTGGAGSLAHEYGHFLDAAFGGQVDQVKGLYYLSDDCSNTKTYYKNEFDKNKHPLRHQMAIIFEKLLWKKQGDNMVRTNYAERLMQIPTLENGAYYRKPVEIWARLFEMYICFKLNQKGLTNKFLSKSMTYFGYFPFYVTSAEMKVLEKEIDKLLAMMRKNS